MRTSVSFLFVVLAVLLVDPTAAQRRPRAQRRGATAPEGRSQRRSLGKGTTTTAFDTYNVEHTSAPTEGTEVEQEAVIASSSGVEGEPGTTRNATPWYIAAGVLLGLLAVGTAYWAVAKNRRQKKENAQKEAEKSKSFRLMGSGAAAGAAVAPAAAASKKKSSTKSTPPKKPAPTKKPSKKDTSGKSLPLISSSSKKEAAPAKKSWFKFGKK